jgi:hypothetical protein
MRKIFFFRYGHSPYNKYAACCYHIAILLKYILIGNFFHERQDKGICPEMSPLSLGCSRMILHRPCSIFEEPVYIGSNGLFSGQTCFNVKHIAYRKQYRKNDTNHRGKIPQKRNYPTDFTIFFIFAILPSFFRPSV